MEEGLIKIIIAIVFFAIAAFVNSREKAKKANDASHLPDDKPGGRQPQPQNKPQKESLLTRASSRQWRTLQSLQNVPQRQSAPTAMHQPAAQPQPAPKPQKAPALPEEGVRVTSKPMRPVVAVTNERAFKNKDDLRRAIILGEVLAPKF